MALVNYWSGVHTAGHALQTIQESKLAEFEGAVANLLKQDRNQLVKLSRSTALDAYLQTWSQGLTNAPGSRPLPAGASGDVTDHAAASGVVPLALKAG